MKKELLENTDLYHSAAKRYKELKNLEKDLQSEIEKAPPGRIYIVHDGKKIKYYLRNGDMSTPRKYLRKSESKTIRTYLQKSYNLKALHSIQTELLKITRFLKGTRYCVENTRKIYSTYPDEAQAVILPVDLDDKTYVKRWCSIPFVTKGVSPDGPIYTTDLGERVRSKSELAIANYLHKKRIPYKYECPLQLHNGRTIHPDFTVLDVAHRKEIYWEHLGMMDDREYVKNAVLRLKDYALSNIFPGQNLVTTQETLSKPLGTDEISRTIQAYLVC